MALSKKNTEYLKRARSRIHGSQNWRKTEGYDDLWKRLLDLYRGKHFESKPSSEDQIAINIAFSTINVIGPSISVNHPKITVMARQAEQEDQAVIVESIINYWWVTHEVRPEFRRAVKDFLIFGHGWLKTGYRFVEEEVDRSAEEIDADFQESVALADEFALTDPELAGDLPDDEDIMDAIPSTDMRVVEDRPFVERVSPHDIFVDPEATSMEDLRWIAQRIIKDVDEVKADDRYKSSTRRKCKPDSLIKEEMRAPGSREKDQEHGRVTVWEYYDVKGGTMAVFTDQGDDFLVNPIDEPYAFGHPFVMLRNYEVPDYFYPMGELEAIEPLQQELNKTRSQQMNDRRKYGRAYLYDKRAFDSNAVGLLNSQRDNRMIPVNEGIPLNEAMIPMPQTPMDPSIYQQSDQIERDMSTISGISEYQRGGAEQNIRRTATEASMIQDAANARAADKLATIEDYIAQVAKRLLMLSQQFMSEAQVARIVGANGAPLWFEFEPAWIEGEYDFEVEGGSTQPKNEQLRRQQAMDMMQVMGPLLPSGMVNVPEVLRFVLTGFGIKNPSKFLVAQAPPGMGMSPEEAEATGPDGVPLDQAQPPAPEGEGAAPEGVPDMAALQSQLEGQVGLQLQ